MPIHYSYRILKIMLAILISCSGTFLIPNEGTMNQKKHGQQVKRLYKSQIGKLILPVATRPFVSKLIGSYHDTQFSRRHIKPFIKKFNINMAEAEEPNPEAYRSFNHFFTRKLKNKARPICSQPESITSCADGALLVIENISKLNRFPVKNISFSLETFFNNPKLAKKYYGGTVLVFRLAPWDYHRFHFPATGTPSRPQRIKGGYDSVDHAAFGPRQPLHTNERQLFSLSTEKFGTIMIAPVGALCVGKIIHTYIPQQLQNKGAECGYFCFGGSTVVLVFEKNSITIRADILKNSACGKETLVKMGEAIAYQKNS